MNQKKAKMLRRKAFNTHLGFKEEMKNGFL